MRTSVGLYKLLNAVDPERVWFQPLILNLLNLRGFKRLLSRFQPKLSNMNLMICWHLHLGVDAGAGVVRVSLVHYNSVAEVARLVEAMDGVFGRFANLPPGGVETT